MNCCFNAVNIQQTSILWPAQCGSVYQSQIFIDCCLYVPVLRQAFNKLKICSWDWSQNASSGIMKLVRVCRKKPTILFKEFQLRHSVKTITGLASLSRSQAEHPETKVALKGCLGLPPALAPGPLQILHCHPVGRLQAAPKSITVFPVPRDSTATRGSSLPPWTLISHISSAEYSPLCPPAPATVPHVNYRSYLHHRLWLSKNLSYPQNPGQLLPTDAELKSPGAGEAHQALWSVGHQPSSWRTQAAAEGHCLKEWWRGREGDTGKGSMSNSRKEIPSFGRKY